MPTLSVISAILSTFAVFFSIFSFIFFSFLPWKKKNMVNGILKQIRDFYNFYKILNPWLTSFTNSSKEISKELLEQKIFNCGIPEYDWKKEKHDLTEFDPFDLKSSLYFENLTYLELLKYKWFWKLAKSKLKMIINILDKTSYLKDDLNGKLQYNSQYIKKSNVLIAPQLDILLKTNQDNSNNTSDIKSFLKKTIFKKTKMCLKSYDFKVKLELQESKLNYIVYINYVNAIINEIEYKKEIKSETLILPNEFINNLQAMFNISCIDQDKTNFIPIVEI